MKRLLLGGFVMLVAGCIQPAEWPATRFPRNNASALPQSGSVALPALRLQSNQEAEAALPVVVAGVLMVEASFLLLNSK